MPRRGPLPGVRGDNDPRVVALGYAIALLRLEHRRLGDAVDRLPAIVVSPIDLDADPFARAPSGQFARKATASSTIARRSRRGRWWRRR